MASATDVITYIGMPLAVLGVMPILYNTGLTIIALSKVRRVLRKSRLAGISRGDVINHVIEVELPRFTIAPVDRVDDEDQYWSIYEDPSLIPGGSWTAFNWKIHIIGMKTQRIKYADELRQPQADIGFEELISYLLDLGAVPNAAGFRMLRSSGLWVPTGTVLLLSPDLHDPVLRIAPLTDSDGNLSLAVRWSQKWKMRDKQSLPPYWTRISGPDQQQTALDVALKTKERDTPATEPLVDTAEKEVPSGPVTNDSNEDLNPPDIASSITIEVKDKDIEAIRCHITLEGLHTALIEKSALGLSKYLNIEHLEVRTISFNKTGIWFASAATALGASGQTVLWNYHIPDDVLSFTRKDTIPCGILVLTGTVDESATPEWATKYDDEGERRDLQFRKMKEQTQAIMKENMLPPDKRAIAVRERQMKMHDDWVEEMKATKRQEAQRAETKMIEALQSPKWDNRLVAERNLEWLKIQGHVAVSYDVKRAVEVLLFKMINDVRFAARLTRMLDAWKAFADGGGISKADYLTFKENQVDFAYASLIISVIRDSVTAVDGSLAMDLQESVKIWKRVRLG